MEMMIGIGAIATPIVTVIVGLMVLRRVKVEHRLRLDQQQHEAEVALRNRAIDDIIELRAASMAASGNDEDKEAYFKSQGITRREWVAAHFRATIYLSEEALERLLEERQGLYAIQRGEHVDHMALFVSLLRALRTEVGQDPNIEPEVLTALLIEPKGGYRA